MGNSTDIKDDAGGTTPTSAEIRAKLERILAHPEFSASERRRDFLRFIVEEQLAGRGRVLKGFSIALAVFGRDESFDSQTDPVVRLEARRLRQDLDSYYVGPGAEDSVRISIPKGGYVPYFEVRQPVSQPPAVPDIPEITVATVPPALLPDRRFKRALILAGLVVLAAAFVVGLAVWPNGNAPVERSATAKLPRVAILPFEALDPSRTTGTLSQGLSSELVLNLRGFDNLRLFAPFAASDLDNKLSASESGGAPTYVVTGQVLTEGDRASVLVQLLTGETKELVWGDSYKLNLVPSSIIDLRDEVSIRIATALGQPYGPLTADIRARAPRSSEPENLESYLCVLQAHTYRRNFWPTEYAPVRACLESTVAHSPDYAEAWAMLAWLQLDASRYQFVPVEKIDTEYAVALSYAERAYALAPENSLVVKALSSIHHHIGNYDESERYGRMALELNPHDPDTLAQVGWRLSVRGKYDEGGPLMEQAIQRTVDPPGWYYHLPSLQKFMQGAYQPALEDAEIAAAKGQQFAWFLVTINAAALGKMDKAAMALHELAAYPTVALDPADYMRRHGATDAIVAKTMAEYREVQRITSDRSGAETDVSR